MPEVAAYYALDADPADNPNQPPPDDQAEHKPGARKHVALLRREAEEEARRLKKLFKEPEPDLELLNKLAKGDVVFDYSSAKPTNAQFVAAKCTGVCRYLSPLNADGSDYGPTFVKVLQAAEYNWHLANGRYVRKNYEWYETRMDEGAAAGTQDAYWACKKAWALDQAAGVNPDDPSNWWAKLIIYSNDKDGTPYVVVKAYMLAAYAQGQKMPGKYLPDFYGRQAIYRMLLDDPDIHWMTPGWQTCAWSGGVYGGFADPAHAAAMYQALCSPVTPNIPGCDTNFVMQPQLFGPGGDEVVTPTEINAIAKAVHEYPYKNPETGVVQNFNVRVFQIAASIGTQKDDASKPSVKSMLTQLQTATDDKLPTIRFAGDATGAVYAVMGPYLLWLDGPAFKALSISAPAVVDPLGPIGKMPIYPGTKDYRAKTPDDPWSLGGLEDKLKAAVTNALVDGVPPEAVEKALKEGLAALGLHFDIALEGKAVPTPPPAPPAG